MERLSQCDLDAVAAFGAELVGSDDAEPFPVWSLASLRDLMHSHGVVAYCELDRLQQRNLKLVAIGEDEGPTDGDEIYWRLRHQHPVCSYEDRTGDFRPRKVSDFISVADLRRLEIYNEFFRAFGVEYEMGVGLPAPLTHTKVFIFGNARSEGDFGERERTILSLVRPYLIVRYEQIETRHRADAALAAFETSDEPLVLMDAAGKADFATAPALRLLRQYGFDLADVPDVSPLVATQVRPRVLLLSEPRPLGLTRREREVLTLVAEGRKNEDVAAALWISPHTVGKHLENIYAKIGVRSRTAAVERAHTNRALLARRRAPVAPGHEQAD